MSTSKFALATLNNEYAAYVQSGDDSASAALETLRKIARAAGVSEGQKVMVVEGNRVIMGLAEWSFMDELVLDRSGHPFRGALVVEGVDIEGVGFSVAGTNKLSSIQAFMLCFCAAMHERLTAEIKRENSLYVPINLGVEIERLMQESGWSTQTSDEYSYIDGGSELVLSSSYVAIRHDMDMHELAYGSYSECDPQTCADVIKSAFEEHGLAHCFNKGNTFVNGDLVYSVEEDGVYIFSSKEAKSTKRIFLPFAQVVRVENERASGWMVPRQRRQIMGHVAKAAFFPTLAFMPGHSMWIGGYDRLPVARVPHTYRGFEVEARELGEQVSFLSSPASYEQEGNWQYAYFQDCAVNPGDVVAICNGYELEHSGAAGMLEWVRWQVGSTNGVERRLVVEYRTVTIERVFKGRSIAKAQPVLTNASVLYNNMNEGLPEGIDIIHTMDGIKCDVVYSWLLVVSTTAKHNEDEELLALIADINEEVTGTRHNDYLYIDPPTVFRGTYQALLDKFIAKYGKDCWLKFPHAGDFSWMMEQLYAENTPKGWSEFEVPAGMVATDLEVKGYADGDIEDKKTNVLVFVYNQGKLVGHFQRAFGYVGVQNLEGFESSTVQASVGSSIQLPAYCRSLMRLHGMPFDEAKAMMADGHAKRVLIKALHVMNAGLVGTNGIGIDLQTEEGVAELRRLISPVVASADRKALFGQMAAVLKNHWLVINEGLSIWLPAVYSLTKVDTNSEKTVSLGSLVRGLITQILSGEEFNYELIANRIKGMLKGILKSDASWKLQAGRRMLMAKRVGLPNVPCGETWILQSDDPNSLYQKAISLGLKDGDILGDNRAPMADGSVSKLRYVSQEVNARLFWQLTDVQVFVSPFAVYVDGGDFDGDPHSCTKINAKVEPSTRDAVRAIRSNVLGVDMFHSECEGYARDHYGIKRFAKVQHGPINKNFSNAEKFVEGMIGACIVQRQMVGYAYSVCNLAELANELFGSLAKAGAKVPARLQWTTRNGDATVGKAFELYEVPLGGYSKAAYQLFESVVQPLFGKELWQITDLNEFVEIAIKLGADKRPEAKELSKDDIKDLASAFNTAGAINRICKTAGKGPKGLGKALDLIKKQYPDADAELVLFVFCCAFAMFESARGSNIGFEFVDGMKAETLKGADVLDYIIKYNVTHREEEWFKQWKENSSSMFGLGCVIRDLFSASALSQVGNLLPEDVEVLSNKVPKLQDYEVEIEVEVDSAFGVEFEVEVTIEGESEVVAEAEEPVALPGCGLELVAEMSVGGSKPSMGKVVAIFSAMMENGKIVPCNANLPVCVTGDFKAPVRKQGKNYTSFGFAKGGCVKGFDKTPIGFMAGKICRLVDGTPKRSEWINAVKVIGNDVKIANGKHGVSIVLASMTDGLLDADITSASRDEMVLGNSIANRVEIREAMFSGISTEVAGTKVIAHKAVNKVLADGERHFFALVGDLVASRELREEDWGTQTQLVVNNMKIAHISNQDYAFKNGTGLHEDLKASALLEALG